MGRRTPAAVVLVIVATWMVVPGQVAAQEAADLPPRIRDVEPRVLNVAPRILPVRVRVVDVVVPSGENTEIPIAADVLFAFGSSELTTEAEGQLAGVVSRIRDTSSSRVVVEGHTDAVGEDGANQRLSEARAEAVRGYLAGQAADAVLEASGFGEARPLAPNENPDGSDNPAGRQQNRRVAIVLVP